MIVRYGDELEQTTSVSRNTYKRMADARWHLKQSVDCLMEALEALPPDRDAHLFGCELSLLRDDIQGMIWHLDEAMHASEEEGEERWSAAVAIAREHGYGMSGVATSHGCARLAPGPRTSPSSSGGGDMVSRNVCALCMDPEARTDRYVISPFTTIVLCPACAEEMGLFEALIEGESE